jgi:hypothetical protein
MPDMNAPDPGNGFYLMQNHPNPFNPSTVIEYGIGTRGVVRLTVVDGEGRTVATLVDGVQDAGEHTVQFNSDGLSSGSYFYVIESDGQRIVRSMILSK